MVKFPHADQESRLPHIVQSDTGSGAAPLRSALRAYTKAAIELAAAAIPESPGAVSAGFREWERADANMFILRDRTDPYWIYAIHRLEEQLQALPEYEPARKALQEDADAAELIGAMVGHPAVGGHRVEEAHLVNRLFYEVARINERLSFTDEAFEDAFATFAADLAASTCTYVVVAPLIGMSLNSAPTQLAPGVVLDRLKDDEVVRCLRAGQIRTPLGPTDTEFVGDVAGIRVEHQLPRCVGHDWDEALFAEARRIQTASVERVQRVVEALRLFDEGRVYSPGYVSFTNDWPLRGGTAFAPLAPLLTHFSDTYTLDSHRATEFATFYDQYERARANRILASATHRFALAGERQRADDRIVDLMISAEALFLTDVGQPQERGELRYRLAVRAAFYIESDELPRSALYRHMRRGYDARSAIVHGGELGDDLLKSPRGDALSVQEFAESIEALMRAALNRAISAHQEGTSGIAAWDDLIFGETEQDPGG